MCVFGCVWVFGLDQLLSAPGLYFFLASSGQTKCEIPPSAELSKGPCGLAEDGCSHLFRLGKASGVLAKLQC